MVYKAKTLNLVPVNNSDFKVAKMVTKKQAPEVFILILPQHVSVSHIDRQEWEHKLCIC